MGLLLREIVGWAVTVLGLVLVGFVLYLALNRHVLEAFAVSIPATAVFRAGIALVKLAAAARIAATLPQTEQPRPRSS